MAKARTKKPARKSKALRLPLTPAIREFAASYAPLAAAQHAVCRGMPENATRKQRDAAYEAEEAAQAAQLAFIKAAITRHVGDIVPYDGKVAVGFQVKMRKPRSLEDIAIAAIIALESHEVANALVLALCDATGFDYRRELWDRRFPKQRLKKAA